MSETLWQKLKNYWPYLVIVIGSFLLYSYRLDFVPVHLNQDELEFSLNAYSISRTLHDSYGNFLPFYFWHLGSFWATPIIVYLTAIFLRFLPLSEATIRLPSVFVGVLTIILIMVLVKQIFRNRKLIVISGILAASTPALFIQSRLLLDNLYIAPFVLLWLIFFKDFLTSGNRRSLFLSGLALGVGIHSYHAAKVTMPIYYIATLFYCYIVAKKIDIRAIFVFSLGFLIPILIFIPWLRQHPDTLTNQISYASWLDKTINPSEGIFGVFKLSRVPSFVSSYISYFSPRILFVRGDRSLIHSVQKTGAFLFPLVFLLVFGILNVIVKRKDAFSKLILFGFLTYPVAAALINDPRRISRGLVAIVFVILLSVYGLDYLIKSKDKILSLLLAAILVMAAVQFVLLLAYYFGDYRKASDRRFNGDIGGALTSAFIDSRNKNADYVYVDSYIYFVDRYLLFYQKKLDFDLGTKLRFFNYTEENFSGFPKGSLVVLASNHIYTSPDIVGMFRKIDSIHEPDGSESFYIFYRPK